MDTVTSLDKFRVPVGNQEIELQQIDFAAGGVPMLRIQPMNVMLRTNNMPGQAKPYAASNVTNLARFVRPSDQVILTRLMLAEKPDDKLVIVDDPVDTLRRIIARWSLSTWIGCWSYEWPTNSQPAFNAASATGA